MGTLKISLPMMEVANSLDVASGCMHYLYNHTTGSSKLTGALFSITLLYNLYDAENRVFTSKQEISVYYGALHNVNKRMVNRSKVVIYSRNTLSYPWQPIKLNTFMNIRKNAYQ